MVSVRRRTAAATQQEQRADFTRETRRRSYTINKCAQGTQASRARSRRKLADLVIIDRRSVRNPVRADRHVKVLRTMVAGLIRRIRLM